MIRDLLLIAASVAARDLWVYSAGRIYMWHRVRVTRKRVEAERLQMQRERDERAARIAPAKTYSDTLRKYPFEIAVENNHQFILATREIVCMLRAQDKRRFFTCEHTEEGVN
jgi:hypothetical protein